MCASCHRPEGGDSGIPPLIGLGEAGLAHALIAYKSGERTSHIMHAIALSLSNEEIAGVARFLATREKASPP
jgi:cytochrome c553